MSTQYNHPHIPAEDRDLANEPPELPPASTQVSTTTNAAFGTMAIGFGAIALVLAFVRVISQNLNVQNPLASDATAAALLTAVAGVCLIVCGITLMRRLLLLPTLLLVGAIVCGYVSTTLT